MKNLLLCFAIMFQFSGYAFCQQKAGKLKIDSLVQALETVLDDTQKVSLMLQISWELRNVEPQKTVDYSLEAYNIAMQNRLGFEMSVATAYIGIGYRNMGSFSKAFEFNYKSLDIARKFQLPQRISYACINTGYVYALQGHYSKALEFLLEGHTLASNLKDSVLLAYSFINLARVYALHNKFDQSLQSHEKALELRQKQKDAFSVAVSFTEIGEIYYKLNNFSKALGYFEESNRICETLGAKTEMAINCHNLGQIFFRENKIQQAIEQYNKALNLFLELSDELGQGQVKNNFSELYFQKKEFNKSVIYASEALKFGESLNNFQVKALACKNLSSAYESLKNFKEGLRFQKLYKVFSDSIISNKNVEHFTRLEMQYEFDKVEKQYLMDQQRTELEHQGELKVQKSWRNFFMFGLLVLVLIALLIYRGYWLKQRHNNMLQIKNQEINQQREEILTQNEALLQQQEKILSMAENLQQANEEISLINEQLQQKNENINQSIEYASRIQKALLPSMDDVRNILGDYFIFYRPLEVVSGDFYWIKQIGNFKIYAVADCTGHGIPGAFMSMLSIALLNEIIRRREITKANQVLNELRELVKYSLQQTGKDFETKDGLDISICVHDVENSSIQFAGANSPAYLLRNNEIAELKPDKMPIGIYVDEKESFSCTETKVFPGDIIYLFTDGICDQFGGAKGKKFMSSRLKYTLQSIHAIPMDMQEKEIEKVFLQWKGTIDQVDDILILGVKI